MLKGGVRAIAKSRAPLDVGESRQVETAARLLDRVPAGAPVSAVFDAIKACVPVQAGLLSFIRPAAPEAMASQAVGLAPHLFESWMATPPSMLAEALAPLVASRAGSLLRDSETLQGEQRERLEALTLLDAAGLGEGAGYKAMELTVPWGGKEHVMLALLMERRRPVPARSDVMLAALNPAVQRAIRRLGLPLLAHHSWRAQVVAEESRGYLCLSSNGSLLETNRRAHELVDRYADAAGLVGRRGRTTEFAALAMKHARRPAPWQLASGDSLAILQVDVHRLDKRAHVLPEDIILVDMREVPPPPLSTSATRARAKLTKTQLEVALLFAATGVGDKELATRLDKPLGTICKHMEAIRERLGVSSRGAIAALLTR